MAPRGLSTLDVALIVKELRFSLLNMRLAKMYDSNPRIYIFNFTASGSARAKLLGKEKDFGMLKQTLVVETGVRAHLTQFDWDKQVSPNVFTLKARKELVGLRFENVVQLGKDRVIMITLGGGDKLRNVFIELYGKGNIIITNKDYNILLSLRMSPFSVQGTPYTPQFRTSIKAPSEDAVQAEITAACTHSRFKKRGGAGLALSSQFEVGQTIAALALEACGFDPKTRPSDVASDAEAMGKLAETLGMAGTAADEIFSDNPVPSKAYVIFRARDREYEAHFTDSSLLPTTASDDEKALLFVSMYADSWSVVPPFPGLPHRLIRLPPSPDTEEHTFPPLLPSPGVMAQALREDSGPLFLELDSLSRALDLVLSSGKTTVEARRRAGGVSTAEKKAMRSFEQQIEIATKLRRTIKDEREAARALETYADIADKSLRFVEMLVKAGTRWDEITETVQKRGADGDNVCRIIGPINFHKEEMFVQLPRLVSDEGGAPSEIVPILCNFTLSARANVASHFEAAKRAEQKLGRVNDMLDELKRRGEMKTDLARQEERQRGSVAGVGNIRRALWFEKYNWFFSSDGLLVLSGREAHSNETLVRRQLSKRDLFVHAHAHGAAITIIKAPGCVPEGWVPPSQTLREAGQAAVAHSKLWDTKTTGGSFWVFANQVSKQPPSGEFLPTGSFCIRGRRNPIQPQALELSAAILFRLSPDAKIPELSADDAHVLSDPWRFAYTPLFEHRWLRDAETSASEMYLEALLPPPPAATSDASDEASVKNLLITEIAKSRKKAAAQQAARPKAPKGGSTEQNRKLEEKKKAKKARKEKIRAQKIEAAKRKRAQHVKEVQKLAEREGVDVETFAKEHGIELDTRTRAQRLKDNAFERTMKSEEHPEAAAGAEPRPAALASLCTMCGCVGHSEKECSLLAAFTRWHQFRLPPALIPADADPQKKRLGRAAERQILREEMEMVDPVGLEVDSLESASQFQIFSRFVSAPAPGQPLDSCVMCVGPPAALRRCKYRVGVTPGSLKRGKALAAMLSVFTRPQMPPAPREALLIRSMWGDQLVQLLPPLVALSGAGMKGKMGAGPRGRKRGQSKQRRGAK
eukprot:gnl/Chilomastix_cuspidata/1627.p1 GENE.gnl/Chilomastix_cuspidata/1627~~gnl/Chilomastix_cuspidata/1627.p1  ORF type:complete len:1114 (+),score=407.26 gnl/Chilomastix_cuspidata/1627:62-3343(+)